MSQDLTPDSQDALAAVTRWIDETGPLLVEIYQRHSGAGADDYLVSSIDEYCRLVHDTKPGTLITIARDPWLPLRGIVDDQFTSDALSALSDLSETHGYELVRPAFYPADWEELGSGTSRADLARDLDVSSGQYVWLGYDTYLFEERLVLAHSDRYITCRKSG